MMKDRFASVTFVVLISMLILSSETTVGVSVMEKEKRASITLSSDLVKAPLTPVSIPVDQLFGQDDLAGRWFTVYDVSGGSRKLVPSSFWHWKGCVNWLVADPSHLDYEVVASIDIPKVPYGPAGCGDILRLPPWEPWHIESSMHAVPIFCDWFGNGTTDVLVIGDYACGYGEAEGGIWFFENVGTDEKPLYAPALPIMDSDGNKITGWYNAADVFYLKESPLPSLAATSARIRTLSYYLNEGKRDRFGRPVVRKVGESPRGDANYAMCVRAVDCFGDGVQHIFISRRSIWMEGEAFPTGIIEFFENTAAPGEIPKLKEPVPLKMADGSTLGGLSGSGSADVCDWNGDGKLDVVMTYSGPVPPTVRLFENVGSGRDWVFEDRGIPEGLDDPLVIGRRLAWVDKPFFRGLAFGTTDGRVYRYRVAGKSANGLPKFEYAGYLEGYGCPLSAGVYSVPYVCDWDGSGGRDLVVGCDHGPVWLMRERKTDDPLFAMYDPPEVIRKTDGSMLELRLKDYPNEDFVDGMHGEMYLGMSKPQVVDWDGSGKLDILVSGLTHRLLLFRNVGTRTEPQYDGPEHVEVDDMDDPFRYRQHIVAVDWNKDGLYDIIALDKESKYTYFERYRAADGSLRLKFGSHLLYEDGEIVTHSSIHPWGHYLSPCDWDGDGDWDLIIGIGQRQGIVYLENVGSVEKPVFKRPRRVLANGKPIHHSNHCMRPFVTDWDGNGKLDIISGSESGWVHLFRNSILSIEDQEMAR